MKKVIVLAMVALLTLSTAAFAKSLLNVDKGGVAIQGYDPVAFFTQNKPVKGSQQFQSSYNGATYYFASADNKKLFDSSPAKYEPQFGGYCAYGASKNKTAPIKPSAFQIVDGRLLMQYDEDVRDLFNKDTKGNLNKADGNWPSLVDKYGK
jgi:YHS domain-containing protein